MEFMAVERQIQLDQIQKQDIIKQWQEKYDLQEKDGGWWKGTAVVITRPEEMAPKLLQRYHDSPTAGHPEITKTLWQLIKDYLLRSTPIFLFPLNCHLYTSSTSTCTIGSTSTSSPACLSSSSTSSQSPHHRSLQTSFATTYGGSTSRAAARRDGTRP